MVDTLVQIAATMLGVQSVIFTIEQIVETIIDYRLLALELEPIPLDGTLRMRTAAFVFAFFVSLWILILRGQVVHIT